MAYIPRLKSEYKERVITALTEEFGYKNVMMVPKLEKIVLSRGVGAAVSDKKLIDYAVDELTKVTGQKAVPTISKKDVASFKLRKGMPIGAKVTLRGERMYEFLDRLITVSLPRVRDFNGIKATGFDGRGNYNLGVTHNTIFISYYNNSRKTKSTTTFCNFSNTIYSNQTVFKIKSAWFY